MKTDYAKRKLQKRKTSRKTTTESSTWKGLFIGILLGLACAVFVYKYQQGAFKSSLDLVVNRFLNKSTHEPKAIVQAQHAPEEVALPQFSFYSVLTHDKSAPLPNREIAAHPSHAPKATENSAEKIVTPPHSNPIENNHSTTRITNSSFHFSTTASKKMKERYILQIATVTRPEAAESLRAQLTLLGFAVTLAHGKNNPDHYYLFLGPYHSLTLAEAHQQKLMDNHINALIKKYPT